MTRARVVPIEGAGWGVAACDSACIRCIASGEQDTATQGRKKSRSASTLAPRARLRKSDVPAMRIPLFWLCRKRDDPPCVAVEVNR